ncbi:MAG: precorrin-6y C5,15-methyltransferase (decarboxylating) subunit CbiE [Tissierellia bacterium]|nr:precorrin-6y C5,15-methyltransferase (decarboxylating) subunit CbiE [Tissierellia bacterium]
MIIVAGAGPGNPKLLTKELVDMIKASDVVICFGRISESIKPIRRDVKKVLRVNEVLEKIEEGRVNLILASGDPLYYGITNYLQKSGIKIDKIMPGISSFQYMMTILKKPWQNAFLFSMHGRVFDIEILKDKELAICFTDSHNTPNTISNNLKAIGMKGKMYVGYNLSYETEKIEIKDIGEQFSDISSLAVVVIENEMD